MKENKKALIIKILIPTLVLGAGFGIDRLFNNGTEALSDNPIVVAEDSSTLLSEDSNPLEIVNKKVYGNVVGLSENLVFINDDEALVSIGLSREEFYEKYPNEISSDDSKTLESAYKDKYGGVYKLKLSTLEKIPLNIDTRNLAADVLPNVNKISYFSGDNLDVMDLKSNTNFQYKKSSKENSPEDLGNWSTDGKYLITYNNGNLKVINTEDNSTKDIEVKSERLWISSIPSFYSEDGENIYFIGNQPKSGDLNYQREGIYKINSSSGKIEELLVLPYNSNGGEVDYNKYSGIPSAGYSVLEGGKKIILNATIEGKDGIYIYDVESKKFYNVIPHATKGYGSPMWISPDKTKIIYMNPSIENDKTQWNLYVAKINGNSLTNKICLYNNISLSGSLDKCVQWSGDSKKILFFTGNEDMKKNNFSFKDKNEVNVITFK